MLGGGGGGGTGSIGDRHSCLFIQPWAEDLQGDWLSHTQINVCRCRKRQTLTHLACLSPWIREIEGEVCVCVLELWQRVNNKSCFFSQLLARLLHGLQQLLVKSLLTKTSLCLCLLVFSGFLTHICIKLAGECLPHHVCMRHFWNYHGSCVTHCSISHLIYTFARLHD